jgi:hypothetical protein
MSSSDSVRALCNVTAVFLVEPVTGIERQEPDLGSLGQIGWLVDEEATSLDPVVIVNESLARKYFPTDDPTGRRLNRGRRIGMSVAAYRRDRERRQARWPRGDFLPETFVPHTQASSPYARVIAKDIIVALRGP